MSKDILREAERVIDKWSECEYERCGFPDLVESLVDEVKRLQELSDWQSENNERWRESSEELLDEINQWKGRYEDIKKELAAKNTELTKYKKEPKKYYPPLYDIDEEFPSNSSNLVSSRQL
jgi:uncharacterized coiled-coil DUF342 family protein